MSEQSTDHAGNETPESVAYRLLMLVADLESRTMHGNPAKDRTNADRKWILDTYAECLQAVKAPHERKA
ncbi:MAG TPA: hypothetical protein VHA35_22495 [Dongiaceae bacterium]|nr:hypothetical protein [Dongiaceae bacterium]